MQLKLDPWKNDNRVRTLNEISKKKIKRNRLTIRSNLMCLIILLKGKGKSFIITCKK